MQTPLHLSTLGNGMIIEKLKQTPASYAHKNVSAHESHPSFKYFSCQPFIKSHCNHTSHKEVLVEKDLALGVLLPTYPYAHCCC